MGLGETVGDVVAGRARQLIGVAFGCIAVAHFSLWAGGDGNGEAFGTALSNGEIAAAAPEVAVYAQNHPAYLLAFLVGAALVVRRQ